MTNNGQVRQEPRGPDCTPVIQATDRTHAEVVGSMYLRRDKMDELRNFEALFNLTIRGLDAHLQDDEPNPDAITGALLALDAELLRILDAQGKGEAAAADYNALIQIMDDDLREELHAEMAPCSDEEFLAEYARRHKERFSEDFPPRAY